MAWQLIDNYLILKKFKLKSRLIHPNHSNLNSTMLYVVVRVLLGADEWNNRLEEEEEKN